MVAPVISLPSSKHSGVSGRTTQLFTQHSGECPLRGGYAESLTTWALTPLNQGGPEASWPSFVDPQARVRMVAWPNSAWTQGLANPIAVGLECAGYARFSKAEWLTAEGLKQLENLAHEWAYYWLLEKKYGNEIPLRWLTTTEVRAVMAGNTSIKGFCTHAQIDPASRTDPGPNFPYTQLMDRIKQLVGKAAPAVVTVEDDMALSADDKIWLESAMRRNGVAFKNESIDKRDVYGRQTQMPADVARYLLNYDGTGRSDRTLYALWIDAGLNATAARELAGKILEEQAAQRAQLEVLVNTIASLAAGQQLDTAALLAQVTEASQAGVKRAIESIRTTVVVVEEAPNDVVPVLEAAPLVDQGEVK